MAYAFTVTGPVIRHVDGVKFCTWTVVETDVDATDEFTFSIPTPAEIWLYEAKITDAGGSGATTLDPEVGLAASWVAGSLDEVVVNGTAAAHIRNEAGGRIPCIDGGALHVRSKPDQNAVPEITSRITLKVGG